MDEKQANRSAEHADTDSYYYVNGKRVKPPLTLAYSIEPIQLVVKVKRKTIFKEKIVPNQDQHLNIKSKKKKSRRHKKTRRRKKK